jgi:ABC-type nitrate/sulfonate/bicarbonate transport system substrate-binding protein
MKNSKVSIFVFISVITIIFVTFVLYLSKTTNDDLKVGYMRIASHAPLVFAIENDLFKKHNINVTSEFYPTTTDLINALERQEVEVAFQVTPDLAWISLNRTKNNYYVYFVASSTKEKPLDGFYAKKTDINKESLKEKTIGCFPGPTARAMTEKLLLEIYGLRNDEYKLIEVQPSMQLTLLENDEIYALFTYEPLGTIAQERGIAKCVVSAPVEEYITKGPWHGGIGIFSENLVKYKKSVAINFQKAIIEAFEILSNDKESYSNTLVYLQPGLNKDQAEKVPNIDLVFATNSTNIESIREGLDKQLLEYKKLGVLKEEDGVYHIKIFNPIE